MDLYLGSLDRHRLINIFYIDYLLHVGYRSYSRRFVILNSVTLIRSIQPINVSYKTMQCHVTAKPQTSYLRVSCSAWIEVPTM